jgi:hypothetical protein
MILCPLTPALSPCGRGDNFRINDYVFSTTKTGCKARKMIENFAPQQG